MNNTQKAFKNKAKRAADCGMRQVAHMAHGGQVQGPGTPTSDSIPAMLSKGEYVLPADTVQALGGPQALDGLRAMTHNPVIKGVEQGVPHLANGGMPLPGEGPDVWRGNPASVPPAVSPGPLPQPMSLNSAQPNPNVARGVLSSEAAELAPRVANPAPVAPSMRTPVQLNPVQPNPNVASAPSSALRATPGWQAANMGPQLPSGSVPPTPPATPTPGTPPAAGAAAPEAAAAAKGGMGILGKLGVAGAVGMGAYDTARGLMDGDYNRAGIGALDTAAGAALATPLAPAAGTYLGIRAGSNILNSMLGESGRETLGGMINAGLNRFGLGVDDSQLLKGTPGSPILQTQLPQPTAKPAVPTTTTKPAAVQPTKQIDFNDTFRDVNGAPPASGMRPGEIYRYQDPQNGLRTIAGQGTTQSPMGADGKPLYKTINGLPVDENGRVINKTPQELAKEQAAKAGPVQAAADPNAGLRQTLNQQLAILNDPNANPLHRGTALKTLQAMGPALVGLEGHKYTADSTARTAAATALRDQANKDREFAETRKNNLQNRNDKAQESITKMITGVADVGKDGKPDPAHVQRLNGYFQRGQARLAQMGYNVEDLGEDSKQRLLQASHLYDRLSQDASHIWPHAPNFPNTFDPTDLINLRKDKNGDRIMANGTRIPAKYFENAEAYSKYNPARYVFGTPGNRYNMLGE